MYHPDLNAGDACLACVTEHTRLSGELGWPFQQVNILEKNILKVICFILLYQGVLTCRGEWF